MPPLFSSLVLTHGLGYGDADSRRRVGRAEATWWPLRVGGAPGAGGPEADPRVSGEETPRAKAGGMNTEAGIVWC